MGGDVGRTRDESSPERTDPSGEVLLIGFQAKPVAAVLALFTVAAAVLFHNNFADQNQAIHFVKNFAIAGGLLQVVVAGAGRFSLDARRLQSAA